MSSEPEYRCLQFTIADLLTVMAIVAVLGSASKLPTLFRVIPLLAVLYVVKYRIPTLHLRPRFALAIYALVVGAFLPYLYCCIADHWLGRMLDWIGRPLAVFTVPTISLLYDIFVGKRLSVKIYLLRSLREIVILSPVCMFAGVALVFHHAVIPPSTGRLMPVT